MEAEARPEFDLSRSALKLSRKQRGCFQREGEEDGRSSPLQSFLCSMLCPEAEEDWMVVRSGPAPPVPGRHHSSLPHTVRRGRDRRDQAGLTRPGYWQAGAQNCQAGSPSLGCVVECGSGDTQGLTPLHTITTEPMVRGDTRARTSSTSSTSTSSRSRHEPVAADKMASSEKCPIVRPAIRLPRDLIEKMPSAPNTPVSARKDHVASKLASSPASPGSVTKKSPVTVASMVRR